MPNKTQRNVARGPVAPAGPTPEAVSEASIATAEQEAELIILHTVPQVGFRYSWRKSGKVFYYEVIRETWKPEEIVNTEFIMGSSRHYRSLYREDVLISSNDPRIMKTIDKDPGPKVWLLAPDGTEKVMNADDFLTLVNDNKAVKTQVV